VEKLDLITSREDAVALRALMHAAALVSAPLQECSMIVKREDLVAAAYAGVLRFKEVDSLLVFLAQREANAKKDDRQAMHVRRPWLRYVVGGALLLGTATALALTLTQFQL
jgi:hypothetical protein